MEKTIEEMNQQSSVSDLIVDPASNEAFEVVTDAGVDLCDADADVARHQHRSD
jgi:hypothetical protein